MKEIEIKVPTRYRILGTISTNLVFYLYIPGTVALIYYIK